jgi:hypothetical protein
MARWLLEEIGQLYRTVLLEYGTSMKDPSFLAINAMGKVPTLTHGDEVITEGARSAPTWQMLSPGPDCACNRGPRPRAVSALDVLCGWPTRTSRYQPGSRVAAPA